VKAVDFVLLHGNGVREPSRIKEMVEETRRLPGYRVQPIVFNEDDHFDFTKPESNMLEALRASMRAGDISITAWRASGSTTGFRVSR
jgi:hypothetical protein